MVPLNQNCQSQSVRPELSDSDRNIIITQKLPATSTKLKINMQSKTACCWQKYNFRHILACH